MRTGIYSADNRVCIRYGFIASGSTDMAGLGRTLRLTFGTEDVGRTPSPGHNFVDLYFTAVRCTA